MTALRLSLDFPPLFKWLSNFRLSQPRPFFPRFAQTGGWPWFGPAAIDENLMPWGRSGLSHRPGKGSPLMPTPDRPTGPAFHHVPVLLDEVIASLEPRPGKLFLDGTLGGGGHSEALLKLGARVIGMDQDHIALQAASQRLAPFGDQFCALHGNFRHFPDILAEIGISGLDGILVDLGVSSHQLDEPERGFSFQKDGPLDLRMDPSNGRPASDIINSASVEELTRIFRDFGEENRAWQLANIIAKARVSRPITRTLELSDLIARHSPPRGKRNPATLIFQALRIAVNDELSALQDLLQNAPRWLKPGGRLAIITFHSLEDRIAKHTLHFLATPELDRPEWPAPRPNPEHCLRLLSRKPIDPTPEEIARNPRSRSARLRAAERL